MELNNNISPESGDKGRKADEIRAKTAAFFKKAGSSILSFLRKAVLFLNRHKVITCIVAAIILLVSVCFGVINHYLNKINYNDGNVSTVSDTLIVTLVTGEVVDLSTLPKNADGTYTLPDGRRTDEDGSVWNTDGSVIFYDGSYLTADGTAVLSDGTTIYTNGTVVYQNGKYFESSGITVDKDGYATFSDGTTLHISAFTLDEDGKVVKKPEDQVSSKYYSDDGTTETGVKTDDEIMSEAKSDPDTKDAFKESDDAIADNINNSKIWYNDNIINILLMGIDEGSKNYPYGRSDAMIVVSINKITKQIKLVSFARSAYVSIQGYENTRLNHAHGYGGAALAIDTIQRNYKIRIDNYVSTNFDTFKQLIDVLGGVEITMTKEEASALKSKITANGLKYNGAATYNLNGELALEYVRLRKIDTDKQRTQRQRNVLTSIANKVKSMNIFQMNILLNKILPLITTDLTKTEILSQLVNVPSYLSNTMEQYVLPHKSSALTLKGGFEVVLVDWTDEVNYTHEVFYNGVTPSFM